MFAPKRKKTPIGSVPEGRQLFWSPETAEDSITASMPLLIDAEHIYRYIVCGLVAIETARGCLWIARRALTRNQLANDVERLRLQVNRMESLLTPPQE